MKVLILAVAIAALSSAAMASAGHDASPNAVVDTATAQVITDAGRLGATRLTALNASPWATPRHDTADTGTGFEALTEQVDANALLIGLGVLALALARPMSRALRRQEQQRRATALASTLSHTRQS